MSASQVPADMPVAPPPPGMESNFVDPPSFHKVTLAIGIICLAIMLVSVSIRTYTKAVIARQMQHEDYCAIISMIGFLAYGIIYFYLSGKGLTRDLWNIRAVDFPNLLYYSNIFQLVYPVTMPILKYFILIQLKRIFCPLGTRNSVWALIMILIFANIGYYISCFFTFLFQCVPRKKIWEPMTPGHCIDNNAAILTAGVANFLLDIGILIVPAWGIWRLQMSFKRKMGVFSIFAVGIATCIIAAVGVAYRVVLVNAKDQTRAIAKVGLFTFAELAGTMLVGCMPMFPRFYERLRTARSPFSSLSDSFVLSFLRSSRSRKSNKSADPVTPLSSQSQKASLPASHSSQERIIECELRDTKLPDHGYEMFKSDTGSSKV